jgi:hypothetical protein
MTRLAHLLRLWIADYDVQICEPDPVTLRAALERDEHELRAQSAIVRPAMRGWRVTTREAAAFWQRVDGC